MPTHRPVGGAIFRHQARAVADFIEIGTDHRAIKQGFVFAIDEAGDFAQRIEVIQFFRLIQWADEEFLDLIGNVLLQCRHTAFAGIGRGMGKEELHKNIL